MSRAADITEIDDLIASTSESPWLSVDSTINDLDKPWGVALLPDGQLAIVERGPPQIRKVNPDDSGAAFSELPLPPKCGGLDDVDDIQGLCCDGSSIIIADVGNHCVHRIALPSGEPLPVLSGTGSEGLSYPRAVTVLENSSSTSGGASPFDVRLPERLLCVADAGNARVQTYDAATLAHVKSIGKQADGLTKDGESRIHIAGELEQPIAVCAHGRELFVVDGFQHRVSVFDGISGRFLRSFGGRGKEAGQMQSPFGCIVVRGLLVVSEATRLQVFNIEGECLHVFELPDARDLAGLCGDDARGLLYCADYSRGCVYKLRIGWEHVGDPMSVAIE